MVPGSARGRFYRRTEALKRLFQLQRGHSFVFLITVGISANQPVGTPEILEDLKSYLNAQSGQLSEPFQEAIQFRLSRASDQLSPELLIATMPLLLSQFGAQEAFRLSDFQIAKYKGTGGDSMIHLACVCHATDSPLPAAVDAFAALGAPTYTVTQGQNDVRLVPDSQQSPVVAADEVITVA